MGNFLTVRIIPVPKNSILKTDFANSYLFKFSSSEGHLLIFKIIINITTSLRRSCPFCC